MKVFIYTLLLLLFAVIGGAAFFYYYNYQPMSADYSRIKAGIPELDKARSELKRYKEKESWIKPTRETLQAGLDKEVQAGAVEIAAADNGVIVVNIAEKLLYTPESVTFAKESPQIRQVIASLLKSMGSIKDKQIIIGNIVESVPSQGKGRRKLPAREARDLSAARSLALVKYLEKEGIAPEVLIAAGYSFKQPDMGFKIRDHKTVIIIGPLPKRAADTAGSAPPAKPDNPMKGSPQAPSADAPKPIPIQPSPPKSQ